MKYLFLLIGLTVSSYLCKAQQQLEVMVPLGLSGFTQTTQSQLEENFEDGEFTFSPALSTGFTVRYAFSTLSKQFNLVIDLGYQRLNANYTIEEEREGPGLIYKKQDVLYTDHCIYAGLNYRFNLIQSGNQGIALQAKTLYSIPFTGEFRIEEERRFELQQEPEHNDSYQIDLIYDDEFDINSHLNLGIGLLYSYRFSKLSLFLEATYEYKYNLNANFSKEDPLAIDWQNIYLGLGAGYLLTSADNIEGDQDAFFK